LEKVGWPARTNRRYPAVIAYRLQADRFGDLDHATNQVLDRAIANEAGPVMSARLASFDQRRTKLTAGTVLPGTRVAPTLTIA
jgi:hypothetical protein